MKCSTRPFPIDGTVLADSQCGKVPARRDGEGHIGYRRLPRRGHTRRPCLRPCGIGKRRMSNGDVRSWLLGHHGAGKQQSAHRSGASRQSFHPISPTLRGVRQPDARRADGVDGAFPQPGHSDGIAATVYSIDLSPRSATAWTKAVVRRRPFTRKRPLTVEKPGRDQPGKLEARAGIEPAYTDLQSAASPLRHRASGAELRGERPPSDFAAQWQCDCCAFRADLMRDSANNCARCGLGGPGVASYALRRWWIGCITIAIQRSFG